MKNHYKANVGFLDARIELLLEQQCLEPADPHYGSVPLTEPKYHSAHAEGIGVAAALILGFYCRDSVYHLNPLLLERARLAVEYALKLQHEDGTLDLEQTNFHDAAETAFAVNTLYPAYDIMSQQFAGSKAEIELDQAIRTFLNRSADGILQGGFHTPNHRWVESAALASLARLADRPDCLPYMQKFLDEGLDCDDEGEFTERSAGVYNIVCDSALHTLYRELGKPEFLEHIARNLRMVMKYIEPDWRINTMNSTRQDKGTEPLADIYYGVFLTMALETRDPEFACMADTFLTLIEAKYAVSPFAPPATQGSLHLFCRDNSLIALQDSIALKTPGFAYSHHFRESGVVRHRKGDFTVTIVRGLPEFVKLQYRNHAVHLRLAGSFYARGQFVAQAIKKTATGYEMRFHDRWGYKRPLEKPQGTSDWRKMDHTLRADVSMQDYDLIVGLEIKDHGIGLAIRSAGCGNVPTKFEILLEPGARYITDGAEMVLRHGSYVYQKQDKAICLYPDRTKLEICGGTYAHGYGETMRGTLPGDTGSAFIAMTMYTPFEINTTLRFV